MLSGKQVRHVKRLLQNIYEPHHFYYIHIDESSGYMYDQLQYLRDRQVDNIKFYKRRYRSFWGSNTILYMVMMGKRMNRK